MSSPPRAPLPERRGSTLSDYFTANRVPQSYPGPIASAAAQASQRRMSTSSSSPPQFTSNFGLRRGSVSSVSSTSSATDESVLDDSDAPMGEPASPLARRMSWGARAFKDFKLPVAPMNGPAMPRAPGAGPQSPVVSRGFWMDKPSGSNDPALQRRRMSTSSMPAPATTMPAAKEPIAPKPDPLQERILKGELYMD